MKIIRRSKRVEKVEYFLMVDRKEDTRTGFMFECDEEGQVRPFKSPEAEKNYFFAIKNGDYCDPHVEKYVSHFTEPMRIACDCGRRQDIPDFTNECPDCGALWNSWGQRLAPRSFWGEETGEHPADVDRPMTEQEWHDF